MMRVLILLAVLGAMVAAAGCEQPNNMGSFEREVNASYNANEMSRSRNDTGYVPHYTSTTIAP